MMWIIIVNWWDRETGGWMALSNAAMTREIFLSHKNSILIVYFELGEKY